MDINKLLQIFKNGDYSQVIAQTNDSTNIDELFLRAISFALSNYYDDAIKTLKENENILKDNLSKLIDVHMEICFWNNKFVDAQKALAHYEEYPYVSQEVEEKFVSYRKEIEKKIENLNKSFYNEDDALKMLSSSKDEEVQLAFSEIKKYDIEPFLNSIKSVLMSKKLDSSTRCLGLILLYEKHVKDEVLYNWHGEMIKVIPDQLKTPFQDLKFNKLLKMKDMSKDVAYSQTFETLLATYYLYMYPKAVIEDVEDLYSAFDIVTRRYIGWPENKMRQNPQVEALISKIEDINSIF